MNEADLKAIENGFKRLLKQRASSFVAVVMVDSDTTCEVSDLSGTRYVDVRKSATEGQVGLVPVLPIGSHVIVSRLSGSNQLYVAMMSEVGGLKIKVSDKLTFEGAMELNGGKNGGLVINSKLSAEIAKLNAAIQTLKIATSAGLGGVPTAGPGLAAAFNTAAAAIQPADMTNITNDQIKH